jgi:hypothetical protein
MSSADVGTFASPLQIRRPERDNERVTGTGPDLALLVANGQSAVDAHLARERPPATALEWLGIALTALPTLAERARMVDGMSPHPRHRELADALERLLDGFHHEIAGATALVHAALECHLASHPGEAADGAVAESAESHARMLMEFQGGAPRLSEFLTGSHLTFLGAAVEASGALAHAEIALASPRATASEAVRRARQRGIALRAEQVRSALVAALGGLLAYSELGAERRVHVHD